MVFLRPGSDGDGKFYNEFCSPAGGRTCKGIKVGIARKIPQVRQKDIPGGLNLGWDKTGIVKIRFLTYVRSGSKSNSNFTDAHPGLKVYNDMI